MSSDSLPVLTDFGVISTLILFSHLLRNRSKILQNTYVPSSIIAGLIALFAGPQFLNWLPFSVSSSGGVNIESYPSFLVVLLFATLFLGKRKKKVTVRHVIEHAGDTFFFNLSSIFGQYGFSLLFGIILLHPIFSYLPEGFSLLLPAGFVGGHGTAAAIGTVLEDYGFAGAMSIAYASATIGILVGVLGGMILINIGTRLGWTRLVQSVAEMPMSMKSGFVPEEEQVSMGKETVSPIALDPLTWHFAIVVATAVFSYKFAGFINSLLGLSIPVFCVALLIGGALQKIMNIIKIGRFIDRHVIHRIGSMVTDYLVAFGIASISVKVVLGFALPLILLFSFGTLFTLALVWYLGRRICRNFWFERSMLLFGWNTGSVAMSMVLVRVLDPDLQSGVLEDFGISYFGVALVEIAIITFLPHAIMQGIIFWPTALLITGFFACILLSRFIVGWFNSSPTSLREGEAEIMGSGFDDI
jgi:ESS family glutamate:Na+ symporter